MVKEILNIYKPIGISPLEAINLFKEKNSEYKDIKMTYAGRLDPLAEGILVVLAGEDVHEKDKYLGLDKEYEAEILFGFETDTYDILGLPNSCPKPSLGQGLVQARIKRELGKFIRKVSFSFPPFSSYKIKGKPLFQWAREAKLDEIEIPKKETEIYGIEFLGSRMLKTNELLNEIIKKIGLIKGDFRQEEIKEKWREVLYNKGGYLAIKIRISCSSGTYIRSLAHNLGKKLDMGATLLGLKRIKVGEFDIKDSVRLN